VTAAKEPDPRHASSWSLIGTIEVVYVAHLVVGFRPVDRPFQPMAAARVARSGAILLAVLSGCGQIIGADEYATHEPRRLGPLSEQCLECFEAQCPTALEGCNGDPGCSGFLECQAETPDPRGTYDCSAEFPTSGLAARALYACLRNTCTQQCGGGAHWECVGNYTARPQPELGLDGVSVAIKLTELGANSRPYEGTLIRACDDRVECTTENAHAEGTTDGDGTATLTLPILSPNTGPKGWLGALQLTGGGIWPTGVLSSFRSCGMVRWNGRCPPRMKS
jgi:hypothetical protein